MEANGASEDDILAFMDKEIKVNESKLIESPLWMHFVVTLGIIASFVLLVIGIKDKM